MGERLTTAQRKMLKRLSEVSAGMQSIDLRTFEALADRGLVEEYAADILNRKAVITPAGRAALGAKP